MALLKYFKPTNKTVGSILPDPQEPLSRVVPSSRIEAVNKVVKPIVEEAMKAEAKGNSLGSRGKYEIFSADEKAMIGKRAAEHGVLSTIRHFSKVYPNRDLKESTVRGWKNRYINEIAQLKKAGKDVVVRELVDKKRGRPLLLGKELDAEVQAYIHDLRLAGCAVNTAVVIATAEGIVEDYDANLLGDEDHEGRIKLTKDWAKYLLQRMNFVKRHSSSSSKATVENFIQQFIFDIKSIVEIEEIPRDLVINWDQTAIHYIPVSKWTMASEGSKRVELLGSDDKGKSLQFSGQL